MSAIEVRLLFIEPSHLIKHQNCSMRDVTLAEIWKKLHGSKDLFDFGFPFYFIWDTLSTINMAMSSPLFLSLASLRPSPFVIPSGSTAPKSRQVQSPTRKENGIEMEYIDGLVLRGGYPLFLHTFLPCPQNGPGENVAYIFARISRVLRWCKDKEKSYEITFGPFGWIRSWI